MNVKDDIGLLLQSKQDAQLSQRDRAVGCVIVFAKSRRLLRLELGYNILRTLLTGCLPGAAAPGLENFNKTLHYSSEIVQP